MLPVRLALAAGLAALATMLGIVLSRSPLIVAGTNGIPAHVAVAFINSNEAGCQEGGTLPQGTQAIRVSLSANAGPSVSIKVRSGSTVVAEGHHNAGWGVDETVTVPVKRVPTTIHNARICMAIGPAGEPVQVNGSRTAGREHAPILRTEYLRPSPSSWLSLVSSIARHMGIARAPSGAWVAYLAIAIMIAVCILASRLVLREADITRLAKRTTGVLARPLPGPLGRALRRLPRAAWTCALIAILSAACWSVITPPFQAPDEPSHFAYAERLAEIGRLPTANKGPYSLKEEAVLAGLQQEAVEWHPEVRIPSSPKAQLQLQEDLALPLSRSSPGGAGVAASEPPLYYALEAIPYYLGSSGTLLDQLELMRLLSALMAGLTALFVFLFVRESLPAAPWAWAIGGLGAALLPLLGFTSGVVTPDAMLCAVCAAIFYCLARAFKRGLTRRLAVAIGALTAVGFLTKVNFIGLAPGVMLGLVVLGARGVRNPAGAYASRRAFRSAAIAAAIAVSPVCAYVLRNVLTGHSTFGLVSSAVRLTGGRESLLSDIVYIWQLYLPRLPGMVNYFTGIATTRELWFNRAIGLYGWLDTTFPDWVYNFALIPAGLIAILGLRTLIARRSMLRARLPELLIYIAMSVGLILLIGQDSHAHRGAEGAGFAQPRYLLPLLPLAAAMLVLAARAGGKRWGPAIGALIVVLFLAHDIFSQLLVVARFYG